FVYSYSAFLYLHPFPTRRSSDLIWSIIITRRNRAARGPVGYALNRNSSHWTSRNMGILGTFIFIFLVIHLRSFWYEMHWGDIPRSEEHTSELQSRENLVCRLLLE